MLDPQNYRNWPYANFTFSKSEELVSNSSHGVKFAKSEICGSTTLSQRTRSTRSSHNSQYCRPLTYGDALKYSFFSRTILLLESPTVVAAETTTGFRALILMTQPERFLLYFFSDF